MSDEKGVRLPFVKLGYLLSAVSKPLIAVFVYPVWIFFVRTIDRLGKGVRTAARDALLSQEKLLQQPKQEFLVFIEVWTQLVQPSVRVLALLFLFFYPGDYKTLFYLAFIPGMLSILFIFLVKEKKQPVSTLGKGNFFSFFKYWKIASPDFRRVVPGLLLFALFNSSDIFLSLITKKQLEKIHSPFWELLSTQTLLPLVLIYFTDSFMLPPLTQWEYLQINLVSKKLFFSGFYYSLLYMAALPSILPSV